MFNEWYWLKHGEEYYEGCCLYFLCLALSCLSVVSQNPALFQRGGKKRTVDMELFGEEGNGGGAGKTGRKGYMIRVQSLKEKNIFNSKKRKQNSKYICLSVQIHQDLKIIPSILNNTKILPHILNRTLMTDIKTHNYKLDLIIKIVHTKWTPSFKVSSHRMKKILISNRWTVHILHNDQ